jgi:hypothetical protein
MSDLFPDGPAPLPAALARDGFAFVPATRMRPLLTEAGALTDR